jgi:dihydroorotase
MKILLKNVLIVDRESPFNNTINDIFIVNGIIKSITKNISEEADVVIDEPDNIVSLGWVDCFANFNDPGFEFNETLESGNNAALAGGFTEVFIVPNTQPVVHSKSQVEYIVQKAKQLPINIYALGCLTKNAEGKELAEMYDMYQSGSIAFSDGLNPVQSPGIFLKALQYVKAFNGIVIQMPIDKSIGSGGLMNEGIISTQLGLPGLPAIAEEIMIKRDIDLLKYTQSKLHITGVSTAKSIELIKEAKALGLQISCSVTPYHLFYCDEDLNNYDTNLKVNPPLRTKADMLALRKAVMNSEIDCIATHHLPYSNDFKICEFEHAKNGMIGLQTTFAVVNTVLPELGISKLVNLFSNNAIHLFNLHKNSINIGSNANLTIFTRNNTSILNKENNKSKSSNSPFFNLELKGKIVGVISKNNFYKN